MFSIALDPARLLVDMRLRGFFTVDRAQVALQALRDTVRRLESHAGRHLTLYDATEMQVSPSDTVTFIQRGWADPSARSLWARRVAYCTPSALSRMQLMRLRHSRPDLGIFTTREEAVDWLLDPSADRGTLAA